MEYYFDQVPGNNNTVNAKPFAAEENLNANYTVSTDTQP